MEEIQQVTLSHVPKSETWNLPKGARKYLTPSLTQGPNLPKAVHHADKINVLRNTLLPTPPDLPGVPDTDIINRSPSEIHWTPVRKSEIQHALYSAHPSKASRIGYHILRWAWGAHSDTFAQLITACVDRGIRVRDWLLQRDYNLTISCIRYDNFDISQSRGTLMSTARR